MPHLQLAVVLVVVVLSLAYAGWRLFTALSHAGDPCYGCDGCELKKLACKQKKDEQKFGRSK